MRRQRRVARTRRGRISYIKLAAKLRNFSEELTPIPDGTSRSSVDENLIIGRETRRSPAGGNQEPTRELGNLESAESAEVERCHDMLAVGSENFYLSFLGGHTRKLLQAR